VRVAAVDSGVIVSVSTKERLRQGSALHTTPPAYPSPDGTVVWGQSLLIDTYETWDKFVLTIDLYPNVEVRPEFWCSRVLARRRGRAIPFQF
jgi:hypothetical protein